MKKLYILLAFNFALISAYKAQWVQNCVQLMHNSADPAVANLKIWINDTVWVNNFAFQQSTPRLTFPAGTHTMGVSLTSATNQVQSILQQTFEIGGNIDNQFLLINGITGNISTPLAIHSYTEGIMGQPSPFQGFVSFYNGCTTYGNLALVFTPSLSLSGQLPLNISALAYPQVATRDVDIASPSSGNSNTYTISVNTGTVNLGSFLFPSSAYTGKVVRIVMNSSYNIVPKGAGVGFGLVMIPATGGSVTPVTKIETATGISQEQANSMQVEVFPNPVKNLLYVSLNEDSVEPVHLQVTDMTGKEIMNCCDLSTVKNTVDLGVLSQGVYFLTITQGNATKTVKIVRD